MERVNLSQMIASTNKPILGDALILQTYPFMSEYVENFSEIDKIFSLKYGYRFPVDNPDLYDNIEELVRAFQMNSLTNILMNKKSLEELALILDVDYNPIENYDRYEEDRRSDSGSDRTANEKDSVTDSTVYGEVSTSDVYGTKTQRENLGAGGGTTTNKTSAYNANTFVDDNQEITTTQAVENNYTQNGFTDSHTTNSRTDTFNRGPERENQTTTYGKIEDYSSHVHGNIGVTTATKMMEEHVDFWKNWNFYEFLFNIATKGLLTYYEV